jgi:hypothetical protein
VSARPSGAGQACTEADTASGGAPRSVHRENGGILRLSGLGTPHADLRGVRGTMISGSRKMAKVETLTFAVSFIMAGLLTFVALPLA